MEAGKPQYQHFIPQFLLRNFSHKYVPPDGAKAGKSKKRSNNKKYPGDPVINSLCLSDEYRIDECLVRRVCGLENMYVDTTKPAKEQGRLEKKFGVLENRASCVYRKITKGYEEGKSGIWLKRSEKDILRKFIFLLSYRGEQYYRKYNLDSLQDYEEGDKSLLQAYMTENDFPRPIDVWLHSLETIIDLDMDAEGRWKKSIFKSIYFPIADTFVSHIGEMYMGICTPANPDEEFVLADNCYNVTEGPTKSYYDDTLGKYITRSPRFHMFAPISPRLMIVLRHNLLPEPNGDSNPEMREHREFNRQLWIDTIYGSGTKSMLEDLPIRRATNSYSHFVNGRWMPNAGWNQRLGVDDEFCFSIFKIATCDVRKMNGLFIDHAFHGSRIVFNRKDAFLDLLEWYLTEPCQVGKNLLGEHAAAQLAYIKGLSQFMLREGRAVVAEWTFWPSEHRDLKQFRTQNVAGARFLEEVRHGESDTELDFAATYKRLGGTNEAFEEDNRLSSTMSEFWTRCVDLDWGTAEYEHLRSAKLDWLLDGYQRQPCAKFWMFLKKMRLALHCQTSLSRDMETIKVEAILEGGYRGPEDMLTYSYPVIQGRELNEAMYKAFNESMDLIRGPGRGMESMGHFSLFGNPSWRIPTPATVERWPWDDGTAFNEALLASHIADLDKIPTHSARQNQQSAEIKVEKNDMSGLKKAAQAWLLQDEGTEIPTKAVEEPQPDRDKEIREVHNDLRKAASSWLFDKDDNESSMSEIERYEPNNGAEAQATPDANEEVPPEQPQSGTQGESSPWYSVLLKMREAYGSLVTDERIGMLGAFAFSVIFLSLNLWLLAWGSFLSSHLFHFAAWDLRGLASILAVCWPVFGTLAKYLSYVGGFLMLLWKSCSDARAEKKKQAEREAQREAWRKAWEAP